MQFPSREERLNMVILRLTQAKLPILRKTMKVRTRFAPSPTGFLHIGGARTALFSWAYAKKQQGQFILRIEDTDVARSTPEAVQAILDGMCWLGLAWDEGPHYQMQRMDLYKQHISALLAQGKAYYCYSSKEELDEMRQGQMLAGEKPRYDGRWRPEPGKLLPPPPQGVSPVVRFRNPVSGSVSWDDLVKGRISIENAELDDFIIARGDGTPTYNFCVVIDDWEMQITHVIRGDDHVNNTPRQINLLHALGAEVPQYAHLSMILGDDGQKLSKRHGAVSVMQYADDGYLPETIINYLARLGWSHGDDEIFSVSQFCQWFDLDHITPSSAQFNTEKLRWLNAHYMRGAEVESLVPLVQQRLLSSGLGEVDGIKLAKAIALYRGRVHTLNELADVVRFCFVVPDCNSELLQKHLTDDIKPILLTLLYQFEHVTWQEADLQALIEKTVAGSGLKFPKIAMPLRVMLTGVTQSPSIDAVMILLGRDICLARLRIYLL